MLQRLPFSTFNSRLSSITLLSKVNIYNSTTSCASNRESLRKKNYYSRSFHSKSTFLVKSYSMVVPLITSLRKVPVYLQTASYCSRSTQHVTLNMDSTSSNDNSAQFTSKPSSEVDVGIRNNTVSVNDATCERSHDDEQCSPVSKRSKNSSVEGSSDADTSPSTRIPVVVFDIDNTLCYSWLSSEEREEKTIRKSLSECPIIVWNQHYSKDGSIDRYPHVFLPHLKILFDYLLEQGVRIVFFSSGPKERNLTVIPELLMSFWGSEKFEALKAKGQFDIFSKDHMRKGRTAPGEQGNYVKDLKVVVGDGETLLDAILVEDDPSFVAHDQKPCLYIIDLTDLMFSAIMDKDEIDKNKQQYSMWRGKSDIFCLNSVYYMLGVFKTYFENENYKVLPLREGLNQLVPKKPCYGDFFEEENSFVDDMINLGLSEVRKLVPDAVYY
ncbi:uncharacterized protein LOC135844298 isoform X1 [Planococcus citri]|uniref:uncharacterized protein LOC135844298 isoform X1 n=1 Tax=Planococcus citri TaxID=170843 RepID=UPI0031F80529